jgi:hypothetical protein
MDSLKAKVIAEYEQASTFLRFFSEIESESDFDLAVRERYRRAEIGVEPFRLAEPLEYEAAVNSAKTRAETLLKAWSSLTASLK